MYRKIYFMGIKGVGMTTLAIIAKEAGFIVGGSDIAEEFITDKILKDAEISISVGFKKENVEEFFGGLNSSECLFIATGAHDGFNNPESEYAKEQGIKVISHGEAVGLFMSGQLFDRSDIEGISIAGAHGKTTMTAMIATVLTLGGYDPSFTAGTSEIFPIGAAGHFGKGKFFVAEADEYLSEANYDRTAKLLHQKPRSILINNIDFDHPDFYKNIDEIKNVFVEFIGNLPENGLLVVNGDDENTKEVVNKSATRVKTITYGTDVSNEFVVSDFNQNGLSSSFKLSRNGTDIGTFNLCVPGYHNAKNAAGVVALLMELGVDVMKISKGLAAFRGVKRRMETVGTSASGSIIMDDYAHHPEEIKKTLAAVRAAYPGKKILTIFQFHTFSRTKALFSDFVSAFSDADEIVLLPTFSSQRHEKDSEDTDAQVVASFQKINKRISLLENPTSVVEYVSHNYGPETLVVTMGAGDVYHIGYELVGSSNH